jgi:electron transfer flavoprotein beta subunit
MIAEYLDLPFVSYVMKLDLNGNVAHIERDIEGGAEEVEVTLPAVISAAKGLAEQRIPNMKGIMMAKSKPLKIVEPTSADDWAVVVNYTLPPAKSSVKMIAPENMDELVRLLHEEAKVI